MKFVDKLMDLVISWTSPAYLFKEFGKWLSSLKGGNLF